MSKHSTADDKLVNAKRLREQIRARQESLKQKSQQGEAAPTDLPAKGTNSNNQYR